MNIETLANTTTAATSILALFISTYAFWKQTRQANTTLAVTTLREYEKDFFSSADLKKKRYVTSKFLLTRELGAEAPSEAYELLDYFDTLGLHVNKGVIEVEMAWIVFHFWFDKYWHLLSADVDSLHQYTDGVKYLENCAYLHDKLTRFGVRYKNVPPPDVRYAKDKMRTFLLDEINACDDFIKTETEPNKALEPIRMLVTDGAPSGTIRANHPNGSV